jgi:hypothetical protein
LQYDVNNRLRRSVLRDGRKRVRGGRGTDFGICRQLSEQKLVCEQSPRHRRTPQGSHMRKAVADEGDEEDAGVSDDEGDDVDDSGRRRLRVWGGRSVMAVSAIGFA